MLEMEEAIDRVISGPERKTRVMTDEERRLIAYHETGHALVGWALPMADPVHKITIVARGRSLGHTLALPTHDKYLVRRSELGRPIGDAARWANRRGADLFAIRPRVLPTTSRRQPRSPGGW